MWRTHNRVQYIHKFVKVGCLIHHLDKLLDDEVWPEGILGTKFVSQTNVFVHERSVGSKVGNRFEQDDRGENKLSFGSIHRGSIELINLG